MQEETPGQTARRKRAEKKRRAESTVFTQPIKAVKLCSWEEIRDAALNELANGIVVEADNSDNLTEKYFVPFSAAKYFGTIVDVDLETVGQDSTPDGILDENGMKLVKLSNEMKTVPLQFVDEIIYA